MKEKIKLVIRIITELLAIVYLAIIFLILTNASDELTLFKAIIIFVYGIVAVNIFEWAWSDK